MHNLLGPLIFFLHSIYATINGSGTLDRESRAQDKSFGEIINEVKMIKEKLRHPNVVRYRRVFLES